MNGRDDGRDDVERFARVKVLFVRAAGLPAAEREALLARECEFEPDLRREVEELLVHDEAAGDFLAEGASLEPLPAGEVRLEIPGFRLLEPLGMGASGVVHRAVQERPRREVAIKVLRLDTLVPGQVARFQNEAEILARLAHPGIAQVFEAGVAPSPAGQLPWIAMELVRGRELTRWMREARPAPREVVGLFVALCEAVQHAHTLGIVHRDLKPSNVLVTAAGQPKVLDFGIARALVDERATAERTRTGLVMGTLAYMAPEQARGVTGAVGPASDVYALGVMLFEALAGRLPLELEALDVLEGVRLVCEGEPLRLRSLRPELPPDLETILLKALEKDPLRRYASAGALGADLANWLADRPVLARRPTITYQAKKFVRRNRALTISAGVVILALSVALLQTSARLGSEQRENAARSQMAEFFTRKYFELSAELGFGERNRVAVEEVLERVELQLALDPDDRPLRAALARALNDLGDVHQGRRAHDEADDCYRRAYALREELAREDPEDRDSLSHLSRLCAKRGQVARDLGDEEARDRWFAEALGRDEALVARFPEDLELIEDLGWSLDRVAQTAAERKDEPQAIALRKRRLADAERLVQLEPDNPKFVYNLSHVSYFLIGVDPGRDHAEVALRMARRNVELRSAERESILWLGHVLLRQSGLQAERREAESALASVLEAHELAARLVSTDPGRLAHQELLHLAGSTLGWRAEALARDELVARLLATQRALAQTSRLSAGIAQYAALISAWADLFESRRSELPLAETMRARALGELIACARSPAARPEDLSLCRELVAFASYLSGSFERATLTRFFEALHAADDLRARTLAEEWSLDPRFSPEVHAELESLKAAWDS